MAITLAKFGLCRHCEERSNLLNVDAKEQKIAALPLSMTSFAHVRAYASTLPRGWAGVDFLGLARC